MATSNLMATSNIPHIRPPPPYMMLYHVRDSVASESALHEEFSWIKAKNTTGFYIWTGNSGYFVMILVDCYVEFLRIEQYYSSMPTYNAIDIEFLPPYCPWILQPVTYVTENPIKRGYVQLHTTHGDVKIVLYCDLAPRSCERFITFCDEEFYNEKHFVRNVRDLMIRSDKPFMSRGRPYFMEFDSKLTHCRRGIFGLQNDTTAFHIFYDRANYLDGQYLVCGCVVEGFKTLSAMEEVPVNCNFNPKEPIIINSVTVLVNPYAIPEENEENEELYKTEDMNKAKQHLALLCLGEIGREKGLSFHQNVENIVMEYFKSPSKEIRSAASYALGNIAAGNTSKYLPLIMDQITYRQKKLYPLFDSLKEVLIRNSMDKADFNVDKLFQFLLDHSHSEADGVTDLISQCLGKIVLNKPNELLTKLEMHIESQSAQTRLAAVNAIKYALAKWPQQMDEILYRVISSFPKRLEDDDWRVRRATVLALSTAAESKPLLFRRLIPPLLPLLDQGTFTKLRREVYFGASSEIVDDGGELRTAIINCADSLVDPSILIPYLLIRLKDYQDIDVSFQLLSKLAHTCPSPLLAGVPWNRVLVQSDAFQELLRR